MTASAQSYRFCRRAFGSDMTLDAGSDRPASDSGRFNPFVDVSARPSPMSVAQTDVVRSWRLHSAFSFGGPIMQRGYGDAGDLMDFFGREHLTTVGQGLCHCDSLRLRGDGPERRRSARAVLHNCKHHSTPRNTLILVVRRPVGRLGAASHRTTK